MKKVILAGLVSSIVSSAVFAAPAQEAQAPVAGDHDTTSATLTWKADVPVIIPGAWVTFTGEGGSMKLKNGDMNIEADGSFVSTPIKLELHTYDDLTQTPGDLIVIGDDQFSGSTVESISYTVKEPTFESLKDTDVSNVDAKVNLEGTAVAIDTSIPSDKTVTTWNLEGSNIESMVGGDTITARTVVLADVAFAAAQ